LELFIFCETFIVEILKQIKISKGITNKKIKNIDIPISYLLNIELPLVLNEFDESWKTVINNIDLVRSIRNKIVHDNYKPTRDEAINSANYVRAFVGKVKTEFPKLN
jgi:glycogen synthase